MTPDEIEKAINERIEQIIKKHPFLNEARFYLYHELVDIYEITGEIPEIEIKAKWLYS